MYVLRIRNTWNGRYLKLNNCLESANICDLAVTCHFNYVINSFKGYVYKDGFKKNRKKSRLGGDMKGRHASRTHWTAGELTNNNGLYLSISFVSHCILPVSPLLNKLLSLSIYLFIYLSIYLCIYFVSLCILCFSPADTRFSFSLSLSLSLSLRLTTRSGLVTIIFLQKNFFDFYFFLTVRLPRPGL